jgi:hypothetical protein
MTETAAVTSEPIEPVVEQPKPEPAPEFENPPEAQIAPDSHAVAATVPEDNTNIAYYDASGFGMSEDGESLFLGEGENNDDVLAGLQRFWDGSTGALRAVTADVVELTARAAPYMIASNPNGIMPITPDAVKGQQLNTAVASDMSNKAGDAVDDATDTALEAVGVNTDSPSHTFGRIAMGLYQLGRGALTGIKALPQFQNAASQAKVVNTILKTPADDLADVIVALDKGDTQIISQLIGPMPHQNGAPIAGGLDDLTPTMLLAARQNLQSAGTQTSQIYDALAILNRKMPVADFDGVTVAAQARTVSKAEDTSNAIKTVQENLSGKIGSLLDELKDIQTAFSNLMPKPAGFVGMMDDNNTLKGIIGQLEEYYNGNIDTLREIVDELENAKVDSRKEDLWYEYNILQDEITKLLIEYNNRNNAIRSNPDIANEYDDITSNQAIRLGNIANEMSSLNERADNAVSWED